MIRVAYHVGDNVAYVFKLRELLRHISPLNEAFDVSGSTAMKQLWNFVLPIDYRIVLERAWLFGGVDLKHSYVSFRKIATGYMASITGYMVSLPPVNVVKAEEKVGELTKSEYAKYIEDANFKREKMMDHAKLSDDKRGSGFPK
jgi:hypothetical protein